jgi:hypothetical protein
MSDVKNAYFAGLIDGEGTIAIYNLSNGTVRPVIKVDMTCEKTVRALHEHFGGYFGIKKVEAKPGRLPQWRWEVTFSSALRVCALIRPYLITKTESADKVLAHVANKPGRVPKS